MLQQTRMHVVLPYFAEFVKRFPDLASLAAAREEEVLAMWSGMGYYRRARMLHAGARHVVENLGAQIPRSIDALRAIPGIGRYTAGAIASIAFDERAPVVDGNVGRVMSRIFAIDERIGSPALARASWMRAEELVRACESPRNLNQGLMELGALVCTPIRPDCGACPVQRFCATRGDTLPLPKEKTATRDLSVALLLITDRRGRILMRRESGPLMQSMLHLPHGDTSLLTGTPLRATLADPLGSFRHTITNRRVVFTVHPATIRGRVGAEYSWVDRRDLAKFPHPSYVRKALRVAFG